ncbi:alpha/beta hydrolase [Streptomyces sp. NPDC058293]|uniref:Esterase family protein n=1 Tax=Streptomyces sp. NBC_00119 TaxID=2975659 RepID=A0AAU1UIX8_9ACTN|nr:MULTISPECIES: alpha/beta hydrolase-fold protein [unclassified Streptomyces]MCX4647306.1 esterase family protein [Streptomyces sp. NBC_01446]MCX5319839.1 esterase family protein [Streptomyces sp. NBC_00120]
MGLTSRALEYATVLAALVCVGLAVWVWPRLARRGPVAVLGRLGVIGATQLTILTAFAVAVNTNFEFYGSWDELLGHVDKAPAEVTALGRSGVYSTVGAVRGGLVQPAGPQGLDRVKGIPHGPAAQVGRVESVKIVGRRSKAVNPAFVYLPPQYFQKQFHRQRFPVMVAISGYPGGIMNLAQYLQVPQTADRLLRAGRIQPTVIVMVRPTIAPPRDTECVDVPGGPRAETFFTKDLPEALKRSYRVGHDPSAWGALGYSSGGTCALQLTLRHPGVYTSAAALSADYRIGDDLTTGSLFGSGPGAAQRQREHDLIWRLEHLPVPRVSVLAASSRSGEKDYGDTMKFLQAVKPPMTSAQIILPRGSHHFTTWQREIAPAMQWMSDQLTFPQDTASSRHRRPTTQAANRPHP